MPVNDSDSWSLVGELQKERDAARAHCNDMTDWLQAIADALDTDAPPPQLPGLIAALRQRVQGNDDQDAGGRMTLMMADTNLAAVAERLIAALRELEGIANEHMRERNRLARLLAEQEPDTDAYERQIEDLKAVCDGAKQDREEADLQLVAIGCLCAELGAPQQMAELNPIGDDGERDTTPLERVRWLAQQYVALRRDHAAMKAALEWYALVAHYERLRNGSCIAEMDKGKRARDVLAGLEVKE